MSEKKYHIMKNGCELFVNIPASALSTLLGPEYIIEPHNPTVATVTTIVYCDHNYFRAGSSACVTCKTKLDCMANETNRFENPKLEKAINKLIKEGFESVPEDETFPLTSYNYSYFYPVYNRKDLVFSPSLKEYNNNYKLKLEKTRVYRRNCKNSCILYDKKWRNCCVSNGLDCYDVGIPFNAQWAINFYNKYHNKERDELVANIYKKLTYSNRIGARHIKWQVQSNNYYTLLSSNPNNSLEGPFNDIKLPPAYKDITSQHYLWSLFFIALFLTSNRYDMATPYFPRFRLKSEYNHVYLLPLSAEIKTDIFNNNVFFLQASIKRKAHEIPISFSSFTNSGDLLRAQNYLINLGEQIEL